MTASAILQGYLDQIGSAVMQERFEDYAAMVDLPLNILTSSANLTVATFDDLSDGFDDFVAMMHSYDVTDLIREVKVAGYLDSGQIVGVYETRLMNGPRLVLPTFHSKMWLRHRDGAWKAHKIHNTTNEARWPMLLTRLDTAFWPPEEI